MNESDLDRRETHLGSSEVVLLEKELVLRQVYGLIRDLSASLGSGDTPHLSSPQGEGTLYVVFVSETPVIQDPSQ